LHSPGDSAQNPWFGSGVIVMRPGGIADVTGLLARNPSLDKPPHYNPRAMFIAIVLTNSESVATGAG